MGFGNFAYLWLAAFVREACYADIRVRELPGMRPWFDLFPELGDRFNVPQADIPFRAQRIGGNFQGFDEEYTAAQLERFIERYVASAEFLRGAARSIGGEVVVNVRRGDYYSVPKFRGNFGFDVAAYVRRAVEVQCARAAITAFTVVSDDIEWCRIKLGWLDKFAPVAYAHNLDAPSSLRTIAGGGRLILTNSTFSYWAGYISNVLHGDNHAEVVVPWFHEREVQGGRAYQHDPRWTVVDTIPGGWDA